MITVTAMERPRTFSRRTLLGGAAAGAAIGLGLAGASSAGATTSSATRRPGPGLLPDPTQPVATDLLPQIENIVIVMMENHSFDNMLGLLGRGDGLTVDPSGDPTNTNPWPKKSTFAPPFRNAQVTSFPMPNPCQEGSYPYNTWEAFWVSYAGGRNSGFVESQSGPVSMGYFEPGVMPFTNSLASVFPVCDRYFCSVGAQTYPNRRFLMAGTSLGLLTDDLQTSDPDVPPNGTIFGALTKYGISWKNYYSSLPSAAIWYYQVSDPAFVANLEAIGGFFTDAAAGTLPAVSLVDPNFNSQSEENPQDVQYGDQFLSTVVQAVMASPQWSKTLLVWCYDESGGYYDHVPPPRAAKPDSVAPVLAPGDRHGSFNRYGFRVPAGIVSPYARPDYVSSVVHDHTSVLKLIESKWNLPALTYRDAAADDLLDSVDLTGEPAFLSPPTLSAPADPSVLAGCLQSGPGTIPPAGYVTTA